MQHLHLLGIGNEIAVREHGAFRIAGRAGGIDDDAWIVLIKAAGWLRSIFDTSLWLSADADVVLGYANVAAQLGNGIDQVQRLIGHEVADAGNFDDVGNLAVAELEVDWYRDCAEGSDGHVGIDILGTVAGEDADTVALADTGRIEPVAAGADGFLQIFIRNTALMVDDGHCVRISLMDEFMYEHEIPLSIEYYQCFIQFQYCLNGIC